MREACKKCLNDIFHVEMVSGHAKAVCAMCNSYLRFLPQYEATEETEPERCIPFGKWKGTPLKTIPEAYLVWGIDSLTDRKWRERFKQELERRNANPILDA